MVKKKKEPEYEEFEDEELEQEDEDLNDYTDDEEDKTNLFDDETPNSALGLAKQLNKESETAKAFKDLPRETRFSFLDSTDKLEVKHHARAYRNWKYIEKVIKLRSEEDKDKRKVSLEINKIDDITKLKQYLKDIDREYMVGVVEDLEKEDLVNIFAKIKEFKTNYMLKTIEQTKDKMVNLYEDYNKNANVPSYVDDMDNLGKVVDTSIVSMGYKGNASSHSIMTIQAVKNEDVQKVAEEKSSFSLLDAIKRRIG